MEDAKYLAPWAKQQPDSMELSLKLQECLSTRVKRAKRRGEEIGNTNCDLCGAQYDPEKDHIIFPCGDCLRRS